LSCNSKHFQNNFGQWTSENNEVDKFLQEVQSNANKPEQVMEWIPYNRLQIERRIAEGGFGTVYLAKWLNGPIDYWNTDYQKWERDIYCSVALKILKNSIDSSSLLNEVSFIIYI
jgi:serine/threonine protein kinase